MAEIAEENKSDDMATSGKPNEARPEFQSAKVHPAKTQTTPWDRVSRRRSNRSNLQAPLDVTVLRSGIPDTLPGRSVDLSEVGVGAVLAGELSPGESVGVEIKLPKSGDALRTRALVRYHDQLRAGMEFVGLSAEQQAAIQAWAAGAKSETTTSETATSASEDQASQDNALQENPAGRLPANASESGSSNHALPTLGRSMRGWLFLLLSVVILSAVVWWRWDRGWQELESTLPGSASTAETEKVQIHLPAEQMQRLVKHRVDPEYPDAARPEKLQGVVVLDVVVRKDGSVADVRAINGPDVLAQAAINALYWWRFEPYRVDGQPVVVETTVAVEFKP